MEKLGITTHSTQRGKNAGAQSMFRPFTEEESTLVRNSMLQVYGTFKKRIEDGRGERLKGELEAMAGGRVYTGARALELGLVDELGGLGEAIAHAAEKAGVDADAVKLVPEPKSALEGLFAAPEEPSEDEVVRMGVRPSPLAAALRATFTDVRFSTLPAAARGVFAKILRRVEGCADGTVQLIGPDLRIPLD
jgi:protease-4